MKKEVTKYEEAVEVEEKIACDECGEKFDDRTELQHEDGVTVGLDAHPVEHRRHSNRERDWDYSLFHDNYVSIEAEEVRDYCQECWQEFFQPELAMEVEEEDYYVEEYTEERYFCDFCHDEMGSIADHKVTVNGRIEKISTRNFNDTKREILTRDYGDQQSVYSRREKKTATNRDEGHDACKGCVHDIFDVGSKVSDTLEKSGGLLSWLNPLSSGE